MDIVLRILLGIRTQKDIVFHKKSTTHTGSKKMRSWIVLKSILDRYAGASSLAAICAERLSHMKVKRPEAKPLLSAVSERRGVLSTMSTKT